MSGMSLESSESEPGPSSRCSVPSASSTRGMSLNASYFMGRSQSSLSSYQSDSSETPLLRTSRVEVHQSVSLGRDVSRGRRQANKAPSLERCQANKVADDGCPIRRPPAAPKYNKRVSLYVNPTFVPAQSADHFRFSY